MEKKGLEETFQFLSFQVQFFFTAKATYIYVLFCFPSYSVIHLIIIQIMHAIQAIASETCMNNESLVFI